MSLTRKNYKMLIFGFEVFSHSIFRYDDDDNDVADDAMRKPPISSPADVSRFGKVVRVTITLLVALSEQKKKNSNEDLRSTHATVTHKNC